MGLGTLRRHWNDSAHPQLHTLLNGPLHAIELEDGENEGQAKRGRGRNDIAELKLDSVAGDAYDTAAADVFPSRDVEFLPNPSAKHLREVLGMRAH